ncbi:hypothetical protein LCGC14_2680230, partial [marine sediment metagenome]
MLPIGNAGRGEGCKPTMCKICASTLVARGIMWLFWPQTPMIGNFAPSELADMSLKIAFVASRATVAQTARAALIGRYGDVPLRQADVIVALGGDGFMLHTLHSTQEMDAPVYGMNRGTIGFLMNAYREGDLQARLAAAEEAVINPLVMRA